jgi:opacity protein-like surface antigen
MNSLTRVACASALLVAYGVPAQADNRGAYWFLGAGAGQASIDDYGLASEADRLDDTPTAWRIFAGRRVDRHFALGLGLVDFGEVEASGTSFGGFADRVEVQAIEILGFGLWPVTEAIEIYAVAGYVHWEQDVTQTVTGVTERFDASGQSASLGVGASWWITDSLALQLEWRRYVEIGELETTGRENRWDVATLSIGWRF